MNNKNLAQFEHINRMKFPTGPDFNLLRKIYQDVKVNWPFIQSFVNLFLGIGCQRILLNDWFVISPPRLMTNVSIR